MNREEAFEGMKTEVANRMCHARHSLEVVVSSPTHVSISLGVNKAVS
jgi:hypothetical protein